MEGINRVIKDRILLRVAKVAQAMTTNFDFSGQNSFSRIVKFVCLLMELKRLHRIDSTKAKVVASFPFNKRNLLSFPLSKMVSSPPVVGVSVLLRRRIRI